MTYTVTQADRDAAADWVQGQYGCQGMTARVLDGTVYGALSKAFARHRIETLERAAEAHAEAITAKDADIARLREALEPFRAGEWPLIYGHCATSHQIGLPDITRAHIKAARQALGASHDA